MKIVIASTTEATGGAARAAQRLHRGLRGIGVESLMLVGRRQSGDHHVIEPAGMAPKAVARMASKLERLASQRIFSHNPSAFLGLNRVAFGARQTVARLRPDLVHLHWIGEGLFSVEDIAHLRIPVVWTLHDMWAFTGGCYYDGGCGRYREACGACPQLGSARDRDLTRWVWKRKRRLWPPGLLTIITPSRWLADRARESSLFRHGRVEVIPNGLDQTIFKPLDKAFAREALGLPAKPRLILFGARSSTEDPRKGFKHLHRALLDLAAAGRLQGAEAILFGGPPPREPLDCGLPLHHLGELNDEVSLAMTYAAADLFVAPSEQENLPNTIMESMACGTPCVAFRIGGNPDLIADGLNGRLATPFVTSDLAACMDDLLTNDGKRLQLGRAAREKVEAEYQLFHIAKRHTALYEEVLMSPARASKPAGSQT